ncbi:uncharacterized protein [Narcine bancroftii]|uniref:uncharacterized protein n=1 Tax=Narcine bancroftii TaxID=1343680 RepID=UPI0038315663
MQVGTGTRYSGYSVVDGKQELVIEAGRLPGHWSAQSCELYALCRALHELENKVGTIYTDSKYAFGVVHTFGKIWKERGMITGKGQKLAHEQLITQSLEALTLPSDIAIVHVRGHQTGNSPEARGNRQADAAAKQAALAEKIHIYQLLPTPIEIKKNPIFSREEEVAMRDKGFYQTADGLWWTVDGRQVINKAIARQVIDQLHQQTH